MPACALPAAAHRRCGSVGPVPGCRCPCRRRRPAAPGPCPGRLHGPGLPSSHRSDPVEAAAAGSGLAPDRRAGAAAHPAVRPLPRRSGHRRYLHGRDPPAPVRGCRRSAARRAGRAPAPCMGHRAGHVQRPPGRDIRDSCPAGQRRSCSLGAGRLAPPGSLPVPGNLRSPPRPAAARPPPGPATSPAHASRASPARPARHRCQARGAATGCRTRTCKPLHGNACARSFRRKPP